MKNLVRRSELVIVDGENALSGLAGRLDPPPPVPAFRS